MVAQAGAKAVYDALHVGEMVEHLARGEARRFDLITAADVLIYVGDLAPFFAAAAARLAEGGLLAVTLEAAEADGPGIDRRLRPSRRFAHAADYVQRIAAASGLAARHREGFVLRRDGAFPVEGHLMVFERPPAAPRPVLDAAATAPSRRPRRRV